MYNVNLFMHIMQSFYILKCAHILLKIYYIEIILRYQFNFKILILKLF